VRADWQAAQICAVIANANRDPKTTPEPYKAEDFLLKFNPTFEDDDHASFDPKQFYNELRTWALVNKDKKS